MMHFIKKIRFIIFQSGANSSFYLITGLVIGTILESLSIGLIMPLIILLSQRKEVYHIKILYSFINATGISYPTFVCYLLLGLLLIYLVKSLFITYLTKKQHQYIFNLEAKASERLFKSYLQRPYSFYLQHNSSELIKNVYFEIKQLGFTINQAFIFFSEGLILLLLLVVLIYFEPKVSLIAIIFLGLTILIFTRFLKHKIKLWGNSRKQFDNEKVKILSDALSNIKDIKLYGRFMEFYTSYKIKNQPSVHASMKHATFLKLPSVWLEFLAVMGIVSLIGALEIQGNEIITALPLLSLFTAAAFRILPSLNRISSAYQTIKFHIPVVDSVYDEMRSLPGEMPDIKKSPFIFSDRIELKSVYFSYENTNQYALKNITLTIKKGDYIGLIGDSGSGKSTLIDIIIGLLKPTEGDLFIDGQELAGSYRNWQDQIGYVAQTINLTDDTIKNNIAFGINEANIDNQKLNNAIEAAQLRQFIASLPAGVETLVGEKGVRISGGQRQRIGIARALYNDPLILVLDEATNSLDIPTEIEIINSVNLLKNKKTIIMVTHNPLLLTNCDSVYEIKNTELIDPAK
ncbi:MAG: ABC transporter ATP-binding protein [Bacteroidota bacterium]